MLTIPISGQLAIPIRAIPYCSHGFLSASSVAAFLSNPNLIPGEFDPHTHHEVDHPLTRYDGTLCPFRIDAFGRVFQLHPGIFHSLPQQVENAAAAGQPLNAVKALPPGVFVWLKDVRALFDFLNFQLERQEEKALGFVEIFRHWLDEPFVNIDTETTAVILEGVAEATAEPKRTTVKRSESGGTDPKIQAVADAESRRVHNLTGHYPKKETIAKHIEKATGRNWLTVMREFHSLKSHK